jgi:hypothetical protein
LKQTAGVKPENRVLSIKFKDLSPVTPCLRKIIKINGCVITIIDGKKNNLN